MFTLERLLLVNIVQGEMSHSFSCVLKGLDGWVESGSTWFDVLKALRL